MLFQRKKAEKLTTVFNQHIKPVSLGADAWRRLLRNRMAVVSLFIVGFYLIVSLFLPLTGLILPYEQQYIDHRSLPPSFKPAGELMLETRMAYTKKLMAAKGRSELTAEEKQEYATWQAEIATKEVHQRHYWLGTDNLGRDLLSRVIHGGRISMLIGLIGTFTAALIGILVGAFAGYIGGWVDNFIMRVVDILYGLPYMLLVIIIRAVFGNDNTTLFLAIAMVSWLTIARVVRGQIISLKNAEFVEAARSIGASTPRIVLRHMVPNTLGIVIVFSTLLIPGFIMSESFLSFLGLGISAPMASWGSLVADGVKVMELYPWEILVPAIAMTVFLFAMNFLGDGVRDALDPHSKNKK